MPVTRYKEDTKHPSLWRRGLVLWRMLALHYLHDPGPAGHPELLHDARNVRLHCVVPDAEFDSDLLVQASLHHE